MTPWIGEFVGTMLLIVLGDGVVANVVLAKSKGRDAGWMVISTGWALAVFLGVAAVARVSGAHINPAVSLGLALNGSFPWASVPGYVAAQIFGAFAGAIVVWGAYLPHWLETPDPEAKRAIFCTAPAIRNYPSNFLCEVIGTFVLMFGILAMKGAYQEGSSGASIPLDLGALGAVPVALLVWAIGLSLGGPTGYAINPARDFGPRIAHALLPVPGKTHSDWAYAWVPILGPLVGSALAVGAYVALGRF